MTFILHFNIPAFLASLENSAVVYYAAYSVKSKPSGILFLTSDAGVPGGTIHAVHANITGDNSEALELAQAAEGRIEEFLKERGVTMKAGVMMTEGMHEVVRFWSDVATYTLPRLDEVLTRIKRLP